MARLVFFLIPLVCLHLAASSTAKVFWAIDCGGTVTFTSTSQLLNVTWEPDDTYVRGGVARKAINNSGDRVLQTMRVFDSIKPAKNCYTIPVGLGRKVIARAWFYYGNYDGKGVPPTFELQFDANSWTPIETEMDSSVFQEAVYMTKSATTSICVARGKSGDDPLVSGIQVAVLDHKKMYEVVNSSLALLWSSRVAFGASQSIRDQYGRFWSNTTQSLNISNYRVLPKKEVTAISGVIPNNPPKEVFASAITPNAADGNITIVTPYLESSQLVPIYFAMYFFTDPIPPPQPPLSFQIYLNGSFISNVSVPTNGSTGDYSRILDGSNNTVLDLKSPDASRLPVISAWELYLVIDKLNDGTNSSDLEALSALQNQFKVLQQWTGDPCLPSNYSWEWVGCNLGHPRPRITGLSLSGYGLSGTLPNFSSLDALESIDLSNNDLTGEIPSYLGLMPNLRLLNLAHNNFTAIPPTLQNNTNIKLNVSQNPQLPSSAATLAVSAAGPQRLSAWRKNPEFVLGMGMFAVHIMCVVGAI